MGTDTETSASKGALIKTLAQNTAEIVKQKSMIDVDAVRRHRDVTPDELVPTMAGAAQVCYYQSVRMTKLGDHRADSSELIEPVSLASIDKEGFSKPAIGVRITTEQSWRSTGLTLGHLLHSVSLAPGEVTKIAVMDWQRKESGRRAESTAATESLSARNDQNTVHTDVTTMVANEVQSGSSTVKTDAYSNQAGSSGGGVFGSLFGGGSSGGHSNNGSVATSVGVSVGTKNVAADEVARIHSVTNQAANAVRSRRAATIQESSQSESDTATTRVVANYNHMHSLNIMYYEVIQNYKVETKVVDVERVLFIPFEPFDFSPEIIDTYCVLLRQAATWRGATHWATVLKDIDTNGNSDPHMSGLITYLNNNKLFYSSVIWLNADALTLSRALAGYMHDGRSVVSSIDLNPVAMTGNYLGFLWPFPPESDEHEIQRVFTLGEDTTQRLANAQLRSVTLHAGDFVDPNIKVDAADIIIRDLDGETNEYNLEKSGHVYSIQLDLDLDNIEDISFHLFDTASPDEITSSKTGTNHFSVKIDTDDGIFNIRCTTTMYKLTSQVGSIVGNGWILRTFNVTGKSASEEHAEWEKPFLNQHYTSSEIPVGTGGIFSEAVLGRSNAAEKIDLTRFWSWQDSPIPILPPGINPLDVSTRYQKTDLSTHGLEAGGAVIQQLAAIPQLQGMLAVSEVMKANIFRDMSGAKEAAEAASKALHEASESGQAASKDALEEQKAAMDNVSGLIGKAMDNAKAAEGGGLPGAGGGNASEKGGAVNLEEVAEAGESGGDLAEAAEVAETVALL